MYFGYTHESDSHQLQSQFNNEIKEKFPDVDLRDAYDEIKGYRQEVHLPEDQRENFKVWLLGNGWFDMSMTMQLLMMSEDKEDEIKSLIELAKIQYPNCVKSGAGANEG